ncbi:MAG: SCO family protein [Bacteroidia bacterium]
MQKNKLIYVFLVLIPIAFIAAYFFRHRENKPLRMLPYYGPKNYSASRDTVYHTVPDFQFTDQKGEKISQENVKGKIYVADYFFTSCQSICPVMSDQLERFASEFRNNPSVLILSHTVNPEEDSVPTLKEYADRHHASPDQWHFLTGDKKKLYELARKGYLLDAEEGSGGSDDFIHTQNFALIDKERHIRGFYDGTDSTDVNRLITDTKILLDEYAWKEKH